MLAAAALAYFGDEQRPGLGRPRAAAPPLAARDRPRGRRLPVRGAHDPGRAVPAGRRGHVLPLAAAAALPAAADLDPQQRRRRPRARAGGDARRLDRAGQPDGADRPHRRGARSLPRARHDRRAVPARPRPVQGGQRHTRPPGRRPGAAARRRAAGEHAASRRRRRPAGRRRVRDAAARRARRRARPARSPSASGRRSRRPSSSPTPRSTSRPASASRSSPAHGTDSEQLLQRADVAMYVAKSARSGDRDLRRRAGHQQPRPARPARRPAPRGRRGRARAALPAQGARRGRHDRRCRGAGALAPPDPGPGAARRVHPARRAVGPDAAAHRPGHRHGAGSGVPVGPRRAARCRSPSTCRCATCRTARSPRGSARG